jgi:hypothetical protein
METGIASSSAPAASANEFPLYVEYTGGQGAVYGWVQFDIAAMMASSTFDPMLVTVKPYKIHWSKGASTDSTYYTSGFTPIRKPSLVSPFEPSLVWNGLDKRTAANRITLRAKDLNGDVTVAFNGFAVSKLGIDSIDTSALANDLSLAFDPVNAYVNGSFTYAAAPGADDAQVGCYGVYLQAQNEVRGFFLGAEQTGQLYLGRTVASITVTPVVWASGATKQFTATATYDDGSSRDVTKEVAWSSSDLTKATIDGDGLATRVVTGATTITATLRDNSGNTGAVAVW